MELYQISAVTLRVRQMARSCNFYCRLPGFKLEYGGSPADTFTSFGVGHTDGNMHLNLELKSRSNSVDPNLENLNKLQDFGRIIFHTNDVDALYSYLKNNDTVLRLISFESQPRDATWGERFFHIRDPDGYQLSFAMPIRVA
jgi:catechol 2,3-dioxygenase-like lactoylglutathione lyase family enzyme